MSAVRVLRCTERWWRGFRPTILIKFRTRGFRILFVSYIQAMSLRVRTQLKLRMRAKASTLTPYPNHRPLSLSLIWLQSATCDLVACIYSLIMNKFRWTAGLRTDSCILNDWLRSSRCPLHRAHLNVGSNRGPWNHGGKGVTCPIPFSSDGAYNVVCPPPHFFMP